MAKHDIKFEFGTDFQFDLLKYAVQDRDGYRVIKKFSDGYFTLIEHAVIAKVLKDYWNNNSRVPGQVLLKEEIRQLLNSREYAKVITKEDEEGIIQSIKPMYKEIVQDGDKILEKATEFKSYVELKYVIENVDLKNFDGYQALQRKIQTAITDEDKVKDEAGTALIADIKERQFDRQDNKTIIPTPFKQLNYLTNAGGYSRNSIMVILDKPKKFKTGMMINIARSYLRMKKMVLYVDLENGEGELSTRLEQSVTKKTKREILSGEHDDKVQKILRKFKRMNSEVVIKRFPSLSTTTDDVQHFMDEQYRQYGRRFHVLIFDYIGLMGSKSGKDDDTARIADAYLDVANLGVKNDIEHIWTSHHVKREAEKRMKSKYTANDIAKCIDIVRHVQAVFGLNRSEEEEEAGYQRLEIVEQRDGKPNGKAVFAVDLDRQRADELSFKERKEYDDIFSFHHDEGEQDVINHMRSRTKDGEGDI